MISFKSFCDLHNTEELIGCQSAFRNGVKCAILNLDCSGGYCYEELNTAWVRGFEIAAAHIKNGTIICPPKCPGIPEETPTEESIERFKTAECWECGKSGDLHLLWSHFCREHCNSEECYKGSHHFGSVESNNRWIEELKSTIEEAKNMLEVDESILSINDDSFLASIGIK